MKANALPLFLFLSASLGTGVVSAQSSGSVRFHNSNLNAFASDADGFVSVFVDLVEQPAGTFQTAVVNAFDFASGQFTQCLGDGALDLQVNTGQISAAFTTGPGGFN